ncbi:unnamed protein product [Merluccius merluccius]
MVHAIHCGTRARETTRAPPDPYSTAAAAAAAAGMTEESRGKRRKQANPKRSKVERVCSLGSEGEDEPGGAWSMEPEDGQGSPGLTPGGGTVDPAGPFARSAAPPPPTPRHTPGSRHPWAPTADPGDGGGGGEDEGAVAILSTGDGEHCQGVVTYQSKTIDLPYALEDHYEFLAQLSKATNSDAIQNGGGGGSIYHYQPGSRHEELPPAIWSPGAQHRLPDTHDVTEGARGLHVSCPFCQRNYLQGAALRQHIASCREKHAEHIVCPLCGYTATYRAQMERHLALHNQVQDRTSISSDQGTETRKFKCQQCGKAFKYKHHLKEHLRIHSGEKPYECSNCKKRFSHSGSYSSHLSSKKCLSGGGGGGGSAGMGGVGHMAEAAGIFNGHGKTSHYLPNHHHNHHHHHHHHHSLPTSPPAGGERNFNGKHSSFSPNASDGGGGGGVLDPQQQQQQQLSLQDGHQKPLAFPRASSLSRLWDPAAELSRRASVFSSTALLPYLQSGAKFERVLQQMFHREEEQQEEQQEEQEEEEEEKRAGGGGGAAMEKKRRVMENGGGAGKTSWSLEGRARRGSGARGTEGERAPPPPPAGGGVTCRRCAQLFPNAAVLLQHERYLCRGTREAAETKATQGPLLLPRASFPPADRSQPGDASPGQKPPHHWHSAPPPPPPQLLFAMQSSPTQPRPDALTAFPYWPGRGSGGGGGGSPVGGQPVSPSAQQLPSPKARMRVPSLSGFGSPGVAPPQNQTAHQHLRRSWPRGLQSEPLDLSLPKQPSGRDAAAAAARQTWNGKPVKEKKGETEIQQMARLSPGLFHHQHLPFGAAAVFGYNGFPVLGPMAQTALQGLRGHAGVASVPLGRSEFLSPMAYAMETDTEALLKKIHQDRHALVSEALSGGVLDFRSLGDDGGGGGGDGEAGPGRKRLRKTEDGLYACDICQKTFQKSSSLLRHKYEHTGKRPHECKICHKAFKHKHHLIEHSRLHSGEKPYQCDKCGKRFSHSGSYSQHMNHRYAYCSRDQDPDPDQDQDQDQDQDPDMPLTPGTGSDFGARTAGETPPSLEDSQTPRSFLSDSSLDGGPGGLMSREEEEEEEEGDEEEEEEEEDRYNIIVERMSDSHAEEEEARKSLLEGEEAGGQGVGESWAMQEHQAHSLTGPGPGPGPGPGLGGGAERAELHQWSDKAGEQNGAVEDKLGLDAAES